MPAGRPSTYDFELCKEICEHVAEGMGIIKALKESNKYPSWPAFRKWKSENPELATLYACAREDRSCANEDKIDNIMVRLSAGELDPHTARVMIDTIKWKMAKENPKDFGDKQQIDHTSQGEKLSNILEIRIVDMGDTGEGEK